MSRCRLERAANELPLALLAFARENDADVVITGADLLFFPNGDFAAGWKITIEVSDVEIATGYGRTVLDASLAALMNARQDDWCDTEPSPKRPPEVV
jgi:hypothetical protein